MSFIRGACRRGFVATTPFQIARRGFSQRAATYAQNGYGDPKGDPSGGDPQAQGRNPQVDKEHPGPPPPSSAGGPSSGGSSKPAPSASSSSKQAKNGARPAIHNESPPDSESEDVRKHNEEFENRAEKSHAKEDGEKVDPKFWKGHAGNKEK